MGLHLPLSLVSFFFSFKHRVCLLLRFLPLPSFVSSFLLSVHPSFLPSFFFPSFFPSFFLLKNFCTYHDCVYGDTKDYGLVSVGWGHRVSSESFYAVWPLANTVVKMSYGMKCIMNWDSLFHSTNMFVCTFKGILTWPDLFNFCVGSIFFWHWVVWAIMC